MNIAVIGLGYIGLPTAALLAGRGHRVYGYDVNSRLRRSLQRGHVACDESAGQGGRAREALASGRLHVVDGIPSVRRTSCAFPRRRTTASRISRFVEAAAAASPRSRSRGRILVLESTVPPGATERVFERALGERRQDRSATSTSRTAPSASFPARSWTSCAPTGASSAGARRPTPRSSSSLRVVLRELDRDHVDPYSRVREGRRKHVPRRQHRVRQRARHRLAEELGIDVWETIDAGQQASASRHLCSPARASEVTASPSTRTSSPTPIRSRPNSSRRLAV